MNKFYKVKSMHLVRKVHPNEMSSFDFKETNFHKENENFSEIWFKFKKSLKRLGKKEQKNLFESRINGEYVNDLIPEYMVLEERDGNYYELLSKALVSREDNYYDGIGIYLKGYKHEDNSMKTLSLEEILIPIDSNEIREIYKDFHNSDLIYIRNRFAKFASMANLVLYHNYYKDPDLRRNGIEIIDLDEQLGLEQMNKVRRR